MKDPLEGITLETLLTELVEAYGWEELARRIRINCFANDPNIKSSLHFLRRTPWARAKVEKAYLGLLRARALAGSAVQGSPSVGDEDGGADQPLKDDPSSPEDSD